MHISSTAKLYKKRNFTRAPFQSKGTLRVPGSGCQYTLKFYACLRMATLNPVTSQSRARTWRLSLKRTGRDEDKTDYRSQGEAYVHSNLSPHQCKEATSVQDVKHTGTGVVECSHGNNKCQDLKQIKLIFLCHNELPLGHKEYDLDCKMNEVMLC